MFSNKRSKNIKRNAAGKTARNSAKKTAVKKAAAQTPARFARWRERFVLSLFLIMGAALVTRAGFLQIFETEYLQSQGDARYLRIKQSEPLRGMIVDRHNNPLAISTPVDSIWGHPPTLLKQSGKYSYKKLNALLGKSKRDFDKVLKKNAKREFVYLKRHLSPAEAEAIMQLDIPGIHTLREYRRYYPAGPVASHILGFTNIDNDGQEGIELVRNTSLKGAPGKAVIMQDRVGHVVEKLEQLTPVKHGENIKLSIDARIQYLAYRHLQNAVKKNNAASGSLVALDAKTGEILALANVPDFNPNDRSDLQSARFRNRAITDTFEPGSTVKPFTVAMALDEGLIDPETIIDTDPGVFYIGRNKVTDTSNHGAINVSEVIMMSSNIGAAKIAAMMEPRHLVKTFDRLGFGKKTNIQLRGQQSGVLPKRKKWRAIEHATLSYGYGTSITTLQLAKSYTALANDGRVLPVSLLPLTEDDIPEGERVFSKKTTLQMRAMLKTVVSREGTARNATLARYTAAGKTGTVHRVNPDGGGYLDDSYVSLFAGFAPVSDPDIVMAVVITDPRGEDYYGGKIAGPVFSSVMEGALRFRNVRPDLLQVTNPRPKSSSTAVSSAVKSSQREVL